MLKKILFSVVLITGLATVAGCSTTGTGASTNDGNASMAANTDGVQTSGIGSNGANGLSNPNAMVPGANQRYFFDFDQNNVHDSDLPSIKVQAQYMISHPSAKSRIEGNTDIRGSREYNIALGQRRADAVKKVLLLDGASAGQITTMSYGAEKPIANGNTESDYAQNRRADLNYQSH